MTGLAVITGGGGDIGYAIGRRALALGWQVALLDLHFTRGETTDIRHHAVDVTDAAAMAVTFEAFGAVPDLLVNAAAAIRFGPLLDTSIANFRRIADINVLGTFIPAQLAARGMAARGSGTIINFTSINAINPGPGTGAYPATKAAIVKLSQQMAVEWGPLGIRVNAVAPGFIDCGMSASIYSDPVVRANRSAGVPVRRLGLADDLAGAVMYLASDDAAYVHGHHLVVDGGVSSSLLAHLKREPTATQGSTVS